ncbi:hypothetical protein ACIQCD_26235 [Streptomyces sp. NPDC093250]|uniref:hypothetical protein n=1 Tax=Streptomyces sp. NPDC093250 TaxID=3366036 RepID=UPI003801DB26
MYGHGAAPPPPSGASVITQRVLYAAAGVLCCGLLACVPLFRVAFLRGRALDWAVAWVSLPLAIACAAVAGSLPETDYRTDVAVFAMLLLGAAATAYFLVVDIRLDHRRQGRPYTAQLPPSPHATTMHTPGPNTPYGYPQQTSPYAPTPIPQPPSPHTPVPPAPVPPQPGPPQPPAPARIDQVRAELDELSDYLRRQDGQQGQQGQHGNGEGGR